MRVTRLEVFGFKSFLERLILPLEAGITGVVGPNGCGKSNIVDALRWILGETKASNLRGGVLEDVIFNGTDKLRPLGLAEVTLSLRASEDDFFSNLSKPPPLAKAQSHHAVLDRAGDGRPQLMVIDGALAKETATSEDPIEEALAEDGVSGESAADDSATEGEPATDQPLGGNSIAELSSSDSVAALPSSDSVAALPSSDSVAGQPLGDSAGAAGIEEQAEPGQSVLSRFAWLKTVEEVQVTRRLYRSGESEFFINRVPCRLKDIKDLFRAVGLGARAYTVVAQGEVSRIVTARPEERRLIFEEAAGVAGFRDRIASANRRLEETGINVTRLDDVIKEVTRQVNSLKVQASRAKNREQLKSRLRELDLQTFGHGLLDIGQRMNAARALHEEAIGGEQEKDAAYQRILAEEQAGRAALMTIDIESDTIRAQIDAIREELENRNRKRAEHSATIGEIRAFVRAKENELENLEAQRELLVQRLEGSTSEMGTLEGQETELTHSLEGLGGGGEDTLRVLSDRLLALRSELRAKEQALRDVRDELVSAQSRRKALEEQIQAASPASQLKRVLELNKQPEESELARMLSEFSGETALFAECLRVPADYARSVQAVLNERAAFLLAEDPYRLARCYSNQTKLDAQTQIPALGVFRSGEASLPEKAANVPFPAMLDLIEISPSARIAAQKIFYKTYFAGSLDRALGYFESATADPEAVLVTSAGEVISSFSFQSFRHEGGLIQLRKQADELALLLTQCEARHAAFQAEREEIQSVITETEALHAQALEDNQHREARARQVSNELGSVRGRREAAARLLDQLRRDLERVSAQIVEAAGRIEEQRREEARQQAELELLKGDDEEGLQAELGVLKEKYADIDQERKAGRAKLSDLTTQTDDARQARDQARERIAQSSLEVQRLEMEERGIHERVRAEYGEEPLAEIIAGDACRLLTDEELVASLDEAHKIRARIIREGDVDSSTIGQYEEERVRLENLEAQKQDLESAAQTLRETVERLTIASQRRFEATFSAVRENFSQLIPRLFGGGKGSLELLDPEHPLESGIEIIIRPPGKKLKTIDLLSGGEKALCAIALIFAMFLERPSPLCVLDEVDAPLDEANLMRYLALVKEMSAKTQFVMITHNKQSMAMADNLVGVTMQQPGASKIISVSLQEAYAQVA